MHMGAVQPGQLTVEEIRAQYPVAIDSPPMVKATVMPDRVWIADTSEQIKWQIPLDSPASVQPPDEWHAPLLYPAPVAPGTRVMEIGIIPPWVWVAATVGLLGLLLWRAR